MGQDGQNLAGLKFAASWSWTVLGRSRQSCGCDGCKDKDKEK
jgi:hypothetical protein